jgi:hypothetical protein
MIYTIEWMERKPPTATGKIKAECTLVGEDGIKVSSVSIWSDFPGWNELRPGSKVDGTVNYKPFKGRTYANLYPAKNPNGTYRPTPKQDIAKAMEVKSQNIEHAQDKKMEGIKDSSTFRAATDHVIQWRQERLARGVNTTTQEWQEEWINSRKWFDSRFSEPFN